MSSLHVAAKEGNAKVVRHLLGQGADVEAGGDWGKRPLHEAVLGGHVRVVQMLLKTRAEIEATSDTDRTPLHAAAASGNLEVAGVLLEAGADILPMNLDGETPLHVARRGKNEVAQLLEVRMGGTVPLQVFAHLEGGFGTVSCVNLGGESLTRYVGVDLEETGQELAQRIHEDVAVPWTRLKLVLPSGAVLDGERLLMPLRELFRFGHGEAADEDDAGAVPQLARRRAWSGSESLQDLEEEGSGLDLVEQWLVEKAGLEQKDAQKYADRLSESGIESLPHFLANPVAVFGIKVSRSHKPKILQAWQLEQAEAT